MEFQVCLDPLVKKDSQVLQDWPVNPDPPVKQISASMLYGTAKRRNCHDARTIQCRFGRGTACFTCRVTNAHMGKTSANQAHVCQNSAPCPFCFVTWTKTATWPPGMTTLSGCQPRNLFPWCLFRMRTWSPLLVAAVCVKHLLWSWHFTVKAWLSQTVQNNGHLCGEVTAF